jgi:hypothetical protein
VHGSGNLAQTLIRHGLVDEYHLSTWLGMSEPFRDTWRPTESWEAAWRTDGKMQVRRGISFAGHSRSATLYKAGGELAASIADEWRPVLVLATDRKRSEAIAGSVASSQPERWEAWRRSLSDFKRRKLDEALRLATATFGEDHSLARYIRLGIAYHHAGLPGDLRATIEDLVLQRCLHTLTSTTTLAEGIDLPFRVVIIPSVYFRQTPMPKDLYLNIVGRAGRAGYYSEGFIVVVDSDASASYIRNTLWEDRVQIVVSGQLGLVALKPKDAEDYADVWEIESQLLGALGDGVDFIVDDQVSSLVRSSFTGQTTVPAIARRVEEFIERRLDLAEGLGLAAAASPLQLTPSGKSVRLTGLSAVTGVRMRSALTEEVLQSLTTLPALATLHEHSARLVARLLLEASEAFASSFPVRLAKDAEQVEILERWEAFAIDGGEFEGLIRDDVDLLSRWMLGAPLEDLLELAPSRPKGRFSGSDEDRILDLSEHIGRLTDVVPWIWSGYLLLADQALGDEANLGGASWIGPAVTAGVDSRVVLSCYESFRIPRLEAKKLGDVLLRVGLDSADPAEIALFAADHYAELIDLAIPRHVVEALVT